MIFTTKNSSFRHNSTRVFTECSSSLASCASLTWVTSSFLFQVPTGDTFQEFWSPGLLFPFEYIWAVLTFNITPEIFLSLLFLSFFPPLSLSLLISPKMSLIEIFCKYHLLAQTLQDKLGDAQFSLHFPWFSVSDSVEKTEDDRERERGKRGRKGEEEKKREKVAKWANMKGGRKMGREEKWRREGWKVSKIGRAGKKFMTRYFLGIREKDTGREKEWGRKGKRNIQIQKLLHSWDTFYFQYWFLTWGKGRRWKSFAAPLTLFPSLSLSLFLHFSFSLLFSRWKFHLLSLLTLLFSSFFRTVSPWNSPPGSESD